MVQKKNEKKKESTSYKFKTSEKMSFTIRYQSNLENWKGKCWKSWLVLAVCPAKKIEIEKDDQVSQISSVFLLSHVFIMENFEAAKQFHC